MSEHLAINLASWIIQDGNYNDLSRGQQVAFAVDVYAAEGLKAYTPGKAIQPSLFPIDELRYHLEGKVIFIGADWWVVDAGILLFHAEEPEPDIQLGAWVRGQASLSIDCFDYFESRAEQPGAPPLVYDWRIDRIEKSKVSESADSGQETISWIEVEKTVALDDYEDRSGYTLYCTRLEGLPRWTLQPTKRNKHGVYLRRFGKTVLSWMGKRV